MTDGKLLSGQSLQPEQTLVSVGGHARLHYQSDGNLVVYLDGVPCWVSHTEGRPAGGVSMQGDGNLVISDNLGPLASTLTHGHPGAMVQLQDDGNFVVYEDPNGPLAGTPLWSSVASHLSFASRLPPPAPSVGGVRQLQGYARTFGRSFGDDSGPRIVHGCSWFPALVEAHLDWDRFHRQLVVIAKHQMYVRILWRLNGWGWTSTGLTVDPLRDSWFDPTLRKVLQAARDLGLRVNLSSGDMNNCSWAQMQEMFTRVASISASVDQQTVWLMAITNEMRGTWQGKESDENVDKMRQLTQMTMAVYPWNHHAGSDPESQDKVGMHRLAPSPCNAVLIHNTRWSADDAVRRAFNISYENYPGLPIVEDEPTGPNGGYRGPNSQLVYQPIERHADLFAIYTQHILSGSASTYFNDPALLSRQPLESTWGFCELPALWRAMEIPENIGQGTLIPGHKVDAPIRIGSGAARCDSVVAPGGRAAFGIVHGGQDWRVPSGWDAYATFFAADGGVTSKRVRAGEILVQTSGTHDPIVVRLVR